MENEKILIADDDPNIVELIEESLKKFNFKIIKADNGYSVIFKAKTEKPDLIILDIFMPRLDGYEVCKRLKDNVETENIPIIILSGRIDKEILANLLKLGIQNYFVKPFDVDKLIEKINLLLKLRKKEYLKNPNLKVDLKLNSHIITVSLDGEMIKSDIEYIKNILQKNLNPQISKVIFDITKLKLFSNEHIDYIKAMADYLKTLNLQTKITLNYDQTLRINLIRNSEISEMLLLY